jgi:hypothetical protein
MSSFGWIGDDGVCDVLCAQPGSSNAQVGADPGGEGKSLSTTHPQMGIDERIRQFGQIPSVYTQLYTQHSSTLGDKVGIAVISVSFGMSVMGGKRSSRRPWLGFDSAGQIGDLVEERATLCHQLPDLAVGVHHGGVVPPTEGLADLR